MEIYPCISLHLSCCQGGINSLVPGRCGRRVNTLRQRRNEQHFADDIFKCIFFNENVWISIKISLKFVRKGPINNIPALVQIMAWRRSGDKPLSEPMMVSLPTHICVIQIASSCMPRNDEKLTLVLSGNKPFPEPILTQFYVTIWCH